MIRELGRKKIGNLTIRAKEALDLLCEKQNITLANPSESAVREEAEASGNWLHIATLEEDFLKQRAKLHWLEVGDQNNKTFHRAIKTRQAQNMIREIRDKRFSQSFSITNQTPTRVQLRRSFRSCLSFVVQQKIVDCWKEMLLKRRSEKFFLQCQTTNLQGLMDILVSSIKPLGLFFRSIS